MKLCGGRSAGPGNRANARPTPSYGPLAPGGFRDTQPVCLSVWSGARRQAHQNVLLDTRHHCYFGALALIKSRTQGEPFMSIRVGIAAGVIAASMLPVATQAQVQSQRDITWKLALAIAQGAIDSCASRNVAISVAVVDRAGRM